MQEQAVLPSGWRWDSLGQLCRQDRIIIESGSQAAARRPYLGLEDIESNSGKILKKHSDVAIEEGISTTFAFGPDHVLFGKLRPYLNKVALPDYEGRCTTEIIPLLPADGVDRRYLAWLLRRQETVAEAMREKTGSRMPRADIDELLKLIMPLPPLSEQSRIATVLNEQMPVIEKGRAAAEAQLEATKALPAAYLRQVFPRQGQELPSNWRWGKLAEICEFLDSQRIPVNETDRIKRISGKSVSALYPYYGANGQVGWIDDYLFDEPLILLAEDGGFFGSHERPIAYMISGKTWVNNHAHVLRPKIGIDIEFLWLMLAIRPDVGKLVTGNTRPKLNQDIAAQIPVVILPLAEQKRIAAVLKEQLASAGRLQNNIEKQLHEINNLPPALLRKAFGGEL